MIAAEGLNGQPRKTLIAAVGGGDRLGRCHGLHVVPTLIAVWGM
jgi:hypothetical protein